MFNTLDNTVAFTTLDRGQQAAVWNSFFDAVDDFVGRSGLVAAGVS